MKTNLFPQPTYDVEIGYADNGLEFEVWTPITPNMLSTQEVDKLITLHQLGIEFMWRCLGCQTPAPLIRGWLV